MNENEYRKLIFELSLETDQFLIKIIRKHFQENTDIFNLYKNIVTTLVSSLMLTGCQNLYFDMSPSEVIEKCISEIKETFYKNIKEIEN